MLEILGSLEPSCGDKKCANVFILFTVYLLILYIVHYTPWSIFDIDRTMQNPWTVQPSSAQAVSLLKVSKPFVQQTAEFCAGYLWCSPFEKDMLLIAHSMKWQLGPKASKSIIQCETLTLSAALLCSHQYRGSILIHGLFGEPHSQICKAGGL